VQVSRSSLDSSVAESEGDDSTEGSPFLPANGARHKKRVRFSHEEIHYEKARLYGLMPRTTWQVRVRGGLQVLRCG
jgi:hypothetical protein